MNIASQSLWIEFYENAIFADTVNYKMHWLVINPIFDYSFCEWQARNNDYKNRFINKKYTNFKTAL